MIKILINNEEVVCNNNISIKEEMLSTSSTILKNCYPKSWEEDKDYISRYYFPQDYSKCKIINDEPIDFEILGETTQTGTPTPDTPVPIINKSGTIQETIGDLPYTFNLGDIELCKIGNYQDSIKKSTGKNLLDISTIYSNRNDYNLNIGVDVRTQPEQTNGSYSINGSNLSMTFNASWGYTIQYLVPVNASSNYCLSCPTNQTNLRTSFYELDSEYKVLTKKVQQGSLPTGNITTTANTKYLLLSITANTTGTITISNIQLEENSQATSYEPYGKVWYIEKNIGKVILNGSETQWVVWFSTPGVYSCSNLIQTINKATGINCISNYYSNTYSRAYVRDNLGTIDKNVATNGGELIIANKSYTTLSDFKTWLSTHNTTVYTILATPEYTEITDPTLLEQLNNVGQRLVFCGCIKNTGNINLNPRQPHFVDLQVLDFKTLLSEGETLNYVITGKTIVEAINQVVNSISDYGFIVGNIQILNPNDVINAYSTLNKTAYDVFQYIADITQSRWTTRMIDENTIAIDFYDPTLMPTASPIQSTQAYYENNKIIDISFNYSTNDYRNKQIMTSDEVFANITQTETLIADGYTQNFMCQNKLGTIETITVNGVSKTFATKSEQALGITADFYYQPGEIQFSSANTISTGSVIIITYYAIVKGREIILNTDETSRIETQINRKGSISRYENRNDTTSSQELQKIGQTYIKYKGKAEINLKVKTRMDLFNVGQIVEYQAPLEELSTEYMVKSKEIDWYAAPNETFYIYELTSNFNYENAVNYFDNQRAKSQGNIGEGETISRNIDIENKALIIFYDTEQEEIEPINPSSLDFALDGVLI